MKNTKNISEEITADPFMVKFIDPQNVLKQVDLAIGAAVADFGCGSGYFSLAAARLVGEEGSVYSFDVLPQKLEAVESQAKTQGLTNIITRRTNLEKENGSRLENESVDWVLMKDVLYQNKDKKQFLLEGKRILKSNGKILIIEWKPEDTSIGPDRMLRISKEAISELAQQIGLLILQDLEAGDFNYGLVLVKAL